MAQTEHKLVRERRPLTSIHPADYNPRKELKPGDPEFQNIQRSLKEFGYVDPIIINKDGTIIGGHQRASVLKSLGYTEADCIVVDLGKQDEKALNIALNKIGGQWDMSLLRDALQDLTLSPVDVNATGYSDDELSVILGDVMLEKQHEESPIDRMTFTFSLEQYADLQQAMQIIGAKYKPDQMETFGNTNKTGNRIYMVVKEIQIRVIPSKIANPFIRAHHYSGKVVNNSCLHFGAFLDGRLHGVLSYGPSLDKKKIIGLVEGTAWDGFLELNRMAFDDYLPRNSESYCIAKTIRLIRKQAPQVKWIISFADGCSCGDGTIYRACNFVLTDIKRNDALCLLPNGDKIHKMTLHSNPTSPRPELGGRTFYEVTGGKYDWDAYVKEVGGTILPGYQLRYIYFIDPEYRQRLKVPEIPFSRIDELGAGMYKGQRVSQAERHAESHFEQ
nr:MAG: protein of unknown function DUF4338 [Bacteriophage sp.]